MTKPTVTVYTTASCAYCHAEKQWLQQQGIDFQEVAVDGDAAAAAAMIERSGQASVPFTVVARGGQEHEVVGFDVPQLQAAVGMA